MTDGKSLKRSPSAWRPETRLVHGGALRSQFGETSESIFLTQGFVYDSAEQAEARFNATSRATSLCRFSNPTVTMFEERMAAARGRRGARYCFWHGRGHGLLLGPLRAGDHVVLGARCSAPAVTSSRTCARGSASPPRSLTALTLTLGGRRRLAQHEGVLLRDAREPDARPRRHRRRLSIAIRPAPTASSTTSSPRRCCSGRSTLGADVVVYSATKHVDGQGRCLGGVVLGTADFIQKNVHDFLRQTGPRFRPFNAWVLLKGLETLPVCVEAQAGPPRASPITLPSPASRASSIGPPRRSPTSRPVARRQMTGGGQVVTFEVRAARPWRSAS